MSNLVGFISSIIFHMVVILILVLIVYMSKDNEVKLDIINIDVSHIADQDSLTQFGKAKNIDKISHTKESKNLTPPTPKATTIDPIKQPTKDDKPMDKTKSIKESNTDDNPEEKTDPIQESTPDDNPEDKTEPIKESTPDDNPEDKAELVKESTPDDKTEEKTDPVQESKPDDKPEDKTEPIKESTPDNNPEDKTEPIQESKPDDKTEEKTELVKESTPDDKPEDKTETKKDQTLEKIQEFSTDLAEMDNDANHMLAGSNKVSISISATIQSKIINFIKNNWNQPTGLKGVQNMTVDVTIYVDHETGKITRFVIDTSEDYENQDNYQILKTSVKQALKKSQSKPIPIGKKYYKTIDNMNVKFSPKMFGSKR